jgi:outer membrane protein assembly factor BamD
MRKSLPLLAIAGLLLASAGCKSGAPKDPILRLSAEESLATGKDLLTKKKYDTARPYFTHAFEVEPNSGVGRDALLLAADTYYLQAEAKYRDFLNRFPTSESSAYVQFQIANSLAKRMERPDRDQAVTRKALEAYQDLIRLYPTSEYAARSTEQSKVVLASLAEHEYVIGEFYLRFGIPRAACERFEYLLSSYPDYKERDKVIFTLGIAYNKNRQYDEARKTFEILRQQFPQSAYIHQIPEVKGIENRPPDAQPAKAAAATGDKPGT